MNLIRKSGQAVNTWSGGTTRQLYISPLNSSYADRDFDLRISTATVEIEKSVFTSLPGYSRTLMVLEGELKIAHEGQHTALLKKFDTDSFQGDWQTTSYGKATDFNVMTKPGSQVKVQAHTLDAGGTLSCVQDVQTSALYIYTGSVTINHSLQLEQGDFILFEDQTFKDVVLQAKTSSEIVLVEINRP